MQFITFSVGTTNIFPMANSTAGGQYATEFNLRARESVATDPNVRYMIGHSYVHSDIDFAVSINNDGQGTNVSSSQLVIAPGRAVINGHYIENIAPMIIDISEGNAQAIARGDITRPLSGKLKVGLRIMYSDLPTMVGTMKAENNDDLYEGVQVVVLPPAEFKLPSDCPTTPDAVTAHIWLADFQVVNSTIVNTSIVQNPHKTRYIDAHRIHNINEVVAEEAITGDGLKPGGLYTMKGTRSRSSAWCESKDSLMVWDSPALDPVTGDDTRWTTTQPRETKAEFKRDDATGQQIELVVPHKQIDGYRVMDEQQYLPSVHLPLPVADYVSGTSGTVNSNYTKKIKEVAESIRNIHRMPNGKQVGFIESLGTLEDLPALNPAWNIGDYILVKQDLSVIADPTDESNPPCTMYVVLPGIVESVVATTRVPGVGDPGSSDQYLQGMCLAVAEYESIDAWTAAAANLDTMWGVSTSGYRGTPNYDYFDATYLDDGAVIHKYYTPSTIGPRSYSAAVIVTGQVPYATNDIIGGFRNVDETSLDKGYVRLDDNGNLVLIDYELLRMGTLAYQLGTDIDFGDLDYATLQDELNDRVNDRIIFPTVDQQLDHSNNEDDPSAINLYVRLQKSDDQQIVYIRDLDSRFNSYIHLHILGDADDHTYLMISDCQKIRIDNNIQGTPNIELYRSCLYYDADVLDTLNYIEGLSLWYKHPGKSLSTSHTDTPKLAVNGLTVECIDSPFVPTDTVGEDFWSEELYNDIHYSFALKSITFDTQGNIDGCSMIVANQTTANIAEGNSLIVRKFVMPNTVALPYPATRVPKRVKVTGQFLTTYKDADDNRVVMITDFTALSQKNTNSGVDDVGTVTFATMTTRPNPSDIQEDIDVDVVPQGSSDIPGVSPDSYHIFYGGVIS